MAAVSAATTNSFLEIVISCPPGEYRILDAELHPGVYIRHIINPHQPGMFWDCHSEGARTRGSGRARVEESLSWQDCRGKRDSSTSLRIRSGPLRMTRRCGRFIALRRRP